MNAVGACEAAPDEIPPARVKKDRVKQEHPSRAPRQQATDCSSAEEKNTSSLASESQPSFTLEQRLFHALHTTGINSPSIKEFKESLTVVNSVRSFFGKNAFDLVIDVAGGHGALAAIFLILMPSVVSALVLDPAQVGSVQQAWSEHLKGADFRFRHECLRTGLPAELATALRTVPADRILVVACHACQHLSDEILEIACRHGVHAAVMPCCQKDPQPGTPWKMTSKRLGVPIEKVMDLLLAGKAMSWTAGQAAGVTYDVRMKVLDAAVTPQNRLTLCRATTKDSRAQSIAMAHQKLSKAYKRAHVQGATRSSNVLPIFIDGGMFGCISLLATGFALGLVVAQTIYNRKQVC